MDNPRLNCKTCTIELTPYTKINFGCLHTFCHYCIKQYFTDAITNSEFNKLKCPVKKCDGRASRDQIESLVNKEVYAIYQGFVDEHETSVVAGLQNCVIMDKDSTRCPKCLIQDVFNDLDHFYGSCNTCGYIFCTKCGEDYHGSEWECSNLALALGIDEPEKFPNIYNVPDLFEATIKTENSTMSEFECNICFGTFTIGSDFGCQHKYCKTCMKSYLETKIQERSLYKIKCPTIGCAVEAEPSVIEENVSSELFKKYDELLLEDIVAKDMPEVVNCPNVHCQQRVIAEPEYGHCTNCDFRFCTECNQAYHGLQRCGLTEDEIVEENLRYIEASEEERRELERQEEEKRKKQNEENENINLIKTICKKCPSCGANIQKIHGCNRMPCTKCGTNFCWLCLEIMNIVDPYAHFNAPGSKCALH